MELNALLATPALLPSLPRAVALLMSELAHEEPNLRRVNQLFGTDPALAARLLEKANSDAFAGPRTVAGISEALALLGTADLRELVSTAPLGTVSVARISSGVSSITVPVSGIITFSGGMPMEMARFAWSQVATHQSV